MKQHSDGRRMLWTPNTERLFELLTGERVDVSGLAWCAGDRLSGNPSHAAPREEFGSDRCRVNGFTSRCNRCRRAYVQRMKQLRNTTT